MPDSFPCVARTCTEAGAVAGRTDVSIYNLQDRLLFNGTPITVIPVCPPGYYCPGGSLPKTITYPDGTWIITDGDINPGFPIVLNLQGCLSLITRTLPAGSSQAAIQAAANAMFQEAAVQQAQCDVTPPPGGGGGPGGGPGVTPLPPTGSQISLSALPLALCVGSTLLDIVATPNVAMTFQIFQGAIPTGLTATKVGNHLVFSGTASATGTFTFSLMAISAENFKQKTYTINVVEITPSSLTPAVAGVPYTATLVATGPTTGTITWALVSGTMPPGLSLNPATGEISGTATTSQSAAVLTFSFTDDLITCEISYNFIVLCKVTTASPLPDADENVFYSQQLAVAGVASPVWSIVAGALPTGLGLSAGGLIAGVPTATGTFNFTAQVAGNGGTCGKAFVLEVNPAGSTCPAWDAMLWDAPVISSPGGGTHLESYVFENVSGQSSSPGGNADFVDVANTTLAPGLNYNGPGCNCNIHIEVLAHSGGVGEADVSGFMFNATTATIIPGSSFVLDTPGLYDFPFAVPDTLGSDIKLIFFIEFASGKDAGVFTASSISFSGFVENV